MAELKWSHSKNESCMQVFRKADVVCDGRFAHFVTMSSCFESLGEISWSICVCLDGTQMPDVQTVVALRRFKDN